MWNLQIQDSLKKKEKFGNWVKSEAAVVSAQSLGLSFVLHRRWTIEPAFL